MPSTPWAIIVSMPADCVAELSWPSSSISSMSSSAALSRAMFIMWTKNGKLSPGTEKTIWSCSSCRAEAGAPASGTLTSRPNSRATTSRRVVIRCPRIVVSFARALRASSRAALIADRVSQVRAIGADATCVGGLYPWGNVAPCTTRSDSISRATSLRALASFLLRSRRSAPRIPDGTIGCIRWPDAIPARYRAWRRAGRSEPSLAAGAWRVGRGRR